MLCGISPAGKSSQDQYPLIEAACSVSVVDVNLHAKLSQTYVSTSFAAQDVNYVFPLPSDAAVCAFTAVIDGVHIVKGVVKERKQAQRDFDTAVKTGKTAALLKQHTSQVFEVSLGNLRPGQTIATQVEFVSIIDHAGTNDSLRIRIPSTVAPLYGTPPATLSNSRGKPIKSPSFDLSVSLQMTGNITSISSDTHSIAVALGRPTIEPTGTYNPTCAHVSLQAGRLLTEDLVIEVKCDGLDRPRCLVQRRVVGNETLDALSLTLVPCFAATPIASQEYIFLVDRSGSMSGGRIRAVRDALQIMVRSLPSKGTTFNIFSFGNYCDSLWPSSVAYDTNSVASASQHVDRMDANYGGTEVATALKQMFTSRKASNATPAAVLVLTDGEAWDLQNVFSVVDKAVEESGRKLRVFVLGVGNQVSTEMCNGIARAGRGVATYVREQERADAKLAGLLKCARNALIEGLTVDWGTGPAGDDEFEHIENSSSSIAVSQDKADATPVSIYDENEASVPDTLTLGPTIPVLQQAPSRGDILPPLYPGARCSLFALARTTPDAPLPRVVTLRGTLNGTPATLEVPVTTASITFSDKADIVLHTLAARALIRDVEDTAMPTPLTNLGKSRIVQLGTTYNLASSQTSFVAIDERQEQIAPQLAFAGTAQKTLAPSTGQRDVDRHGPSVPVLDNVKYELSESIDFCMEAQSDLLSFDDHDDGLEDELLQLQMRLQEYKLHFQGTELQTQSSRVDRLDHRMGSRTFEPQSMNLRTTNASTSAAHRPLRNFLQSLLPSRSSPSSTVPAVAASPEVLSIASIAREQAADGSFPASKTFVTTQLQLSVVPPCPHAGIPGDYFLAALWHTVLALAVLQKQFTTPEDKAASELIEEKAREWVLEIFERELGVAQGVEANKLLAEWLAVAEVAIQ